MYIMTAEGWKPMADTPVPAAGQPKDDKRLTYDEAFADRDRRFLESLDQHGKYTETFKQAMRQSVADNRQAHIDAGSRFWSS